MTTNDTHLPVPAGTPELDALARGCSPDPLPDRVAPPAAVTWWASAGQWELGMLHRVVREGFAAACDVQFAPNHGDLASQASFRGSGPAELRIATTGTTTAGAGTVVEPTGPGTWTVTSPGPWEIDVHADARPAGLAVLAGATGEVEVRLEGRDWGRAAAADGTATTAPDVLRDPVHELPLLREPDGTWATPAEAFGRVVIRTRGTPVLVAGESRAEALADHGAEQHHTLVQRGDGRWESVHELGFRFLTVRGAEVEAVHVESRVFPVQRRGAFVCSDPVLSQVWATSVHTLRLCAQGLLLDGIKRDRMPWMGDTALGAPAMALAFGDHEVARRTLLALGQPRHGYVNGIVDYSAWWLISVAEFADATGGVPCGLAALVPGFVERLAAEADTDGVLRPVPGEGSYSKPVFVDWGVDVDPNRDCTALQALWLRALRSAVTVLERQEDPAAQRWRELADRLQEVLQRRGWDPQAQGWREYLDDDAGVSVHATLFAVLAGLVEDHQVAGSAKTLLDSDATRTPFVTTFALDALARLGHRAEAVRRTRTAWGAMLEAGATTFWEEFGQDDVGPWAMYGRPFGKSLCHAWAAGPARSLPEIVCGARATAPRWREFTLAPQLGDLDWAGLVVPAADGEIRVLVTRGSLEVDVPAGSTFHWRGASHTGPVDLQFDGNFR